MTIDVEKYYVQYGPMVMRRCRQLLKNEDTAVDAMQDTFVQLLRYSTQLNDTAPTSLLYRIATNVSLNKIRSVKNRHEICDDSIVEEIACSPRIEERFFATETITKLFATHKDTTRTMAVLHFVDGLTYKEVASEVKMSVSGVRKRLAPLKTELKTLQHANTCAA